MSSRKKVKKIMNVEWRMGADGIGYYSNNNGERIASSYEGLEERYMRKLEDEKYYERMMKESEEA